MMIVIGLRSESNGGSNARRVLAGLQHFKQLAFPTPSGKFVKAPIDFVYATTPQNNQERIDKVVGLHAPDSDYPTTHCVECKADYPCETVRILTESA